MLQAHFFTASVEYGEMSKDKTNCQNNISRLSDIYEVSDMLCEIGCINKISQNFHPTKAGI